MTVATFVQPDSTAQTGTAYKANIDAAVKVASRSVQWFAPHEESSLAMTVRLEAGFIQTASGLAEVSAQSTGTISAPSSDPRKDLIVVDAGNGAVSVITGTEDASPTVPTLTAGKIPIAVVTLATDTTIIDNTLIQDMRSWGLAPATTAEMESGTETELRAVSPALVAAALSGVSRNLVADPDFRITPETTSMTAATTPANNDDTYFNQLILLSDGNDIVDLSIDTAVTPTGAYASLKFDVQTANKKFGFLIPFRARDAAEIIGGVASAGFEARTTSGAIIENIRMGLITWDGTADTITSDVVSAWAAEGTNPTLIANWTFENTPANQTVTADAYAEHKIENVSIDTASGKNVGLLVWVDDADAAINDLLYISKLRVNSGSKLMAWRPNSTAEENSRMARMLFLDGGRGFSGHVINATTVAVDVSFPTVMDVPPTATLIDTSPAVNIGSDITGSGSAIVAGVTSRGAKINVDGFTGLTAGQGLSLNNLTTVFKFDARL